MESFIGLFFPPFSQESFANQETSVQLLLPFSVLLKMRVLCSIHNVFIVVTLLDNWMTYFCLNFPRLYRSDYGLRFLWCGFAILKHLVILVKKKIVLSWFSLGKTTSPLTPVLSETPQTTDWHCSSRTEVRVWISEIMAIFTFRDSLDLSLDILHKRCHLNLTEV